MKDGAGDKHTRVSASGVKADDGESVVSIAINVATKRSSKSVDKEKIMTELYEAMQRAVASIQPVLVLDDVPSKNTPSHSAGVVTKPVTSDEH